MWTQQATHPTDDVRWRIVDTTMRRYGHQPHALIETLHTVQDSFGYLETEALRYVALSLRVPFSQVYGVATFYNLFTLKPHGRHTCVVCAGTACYLKGAQDIIGAIREKYDVEPGETTEDGELSLLTARCVGSCGMAPAVVFDGDVSGKLDPAKALERLAHLGQSAPHEQGVSHDA